jgi:ATP-dependent protease ClpP protease subunit
MTLMVHLMSERTGKTPDAIEDFIRRKDVSLTAKEAKKWGLIDRIIQVK